jgi:hypothetical protein
LLPRYFGSGKEKKKIKFDLKVLEHHRQWYVTRVPSFTAATPQPKHTSVAAMLAGKLQLVVFN